MKNDKTAEMIIVGAAAVVRSGHTLEDWRKALYFDPVLGLYDDDDNLIFGFKIEKGIGSFVENGIVFSSVPDQNGLACATVLLDADCPDRKEYAAERYGLALLRLLEAEENIGDVVRRADEAKQKAAGMITVI